MVDAISFGGRGCLHTGPVISALRYHRVGKTNLTVGAKGSRQVDKHVLRGVAWLLVVSAGILLMASSCCTGRSCAAVCVVTLCRHGGMDDEWLKREDGKYLGLTLVVEEWRLWWEELWVVMVELVIESLLAL